MDARRRYLLQAGPAVLFLSVFRPAWAASKIIAVRLWPSPEYSRLTLESETELRSRYRLQTSPPILNIDLDNLSLDATLNSLKTKLRPDDPFLQGIEVTQLSADTVRIQVALHQAVRVQTHQFKPIEPYQHRLVFDMQGIVAQDPLAVLMAEIGRTPHPKATPAVQATALGNAHDDPLSALLQAQAVSAFAPKIASSDDATTATVPPKKAVAPTKTTSSKTAEPAAAQTADQDQRVIIVALDPGHGGEDPGAIGPSGTREKDVVLRIAKRLQALINERQINGNPLRAFLTRDTDYFVPLGQRIRKAQQVQADLFISIHADAFTNPAARGASVFALSTRGASSAAASWIARKENQADAVGGAILTHTDHQTQRFLLDLSTSVQVRDSLKLGSAVVGRLSSFAKMHKNQVEQAGFAVLKSPDIPSILVETAFISNPEEEQLLLTEAYQTQVAESILQGIRSYFAQNPPLARKSRRI